MLSMVQSCTQCTACVGAVLSCTYLVQEYKPLMDWKVVAAAPLVIENQLPVRGTYMIWETPRVCCIFKAVT